MLLGGLIPGGLNCLLKDFTLPDQGTGPDDLQVLEVCSVLREPVGRGRLNSLTK